MLFINGSMILDFLFSFGFSSKGSHISRAINLRNMIQELAWILLSLNGVKLLNFHVVVAGPSQTFKDLHPAYGSLNGLASAYFH